jgi:hypothetical protein
MERSRAHYANSFTEVRGIVARSEPAECVALDRLSKVPRRLLRAFARE